MPNELLVLVAENLSIGDLSKFHSTSQRLYFVLTPRYKKLCLEDIGKLTALQWAAVRGHVELIKLAISTGAEINKPLESFLYKTAPLVSDRPGSVCRLANRAIFPVTRDSACTSLYLATCSGKLPAIKVLLEAGASITCFSEIDTPAHIAAYKGDVDCMRAFIVAGFDIKTRGCGRRTILHEALCGGVRMVRYLLEDAGGELLVNTGDYLFHTPLHVVARSFPVRYQRRVLTKLLLQHGADIHARDFSGNTPAHVAAFMGDVDTLRVLIAAGVDFHDRGLGGLTILHKAVYNRKGVLEYLLKQQGVREIIHVADDFGSIPMNHAVLPKAQKALKQVIEHGKNTKERVDYGNCESTGTGWQCVYGRQLFVFLLLLLCVLFFYWGVM